jgi:hypothetical protein
MAKDAIPCYLTILELQDSENIGENAQSFP